MASPGGGGRNVCRGCRSSFPAWADLRAHLAANPSHSHGRPDASVSGVAVTGRTGPFLGRSTSLSRCRTCGEAFPDVTALRGHFDASPKCVLRTCSKCGERVGAGMGLRDHLASHPECWNVSCPL